jgi:hypothetical protein
MCFDIMITLKSLSIGWLQVLAPWRLDFDYTSILRTKANIRVVVTRLAIVGVQCGVVVWGVHCSRRYEGSCGRQFEGCNCDRGLIQDQKGVL